MNFYYYELYDDFHHWQKQPMIQAENDDKAVEMLINMFGNNLMTVYVEQNGKFRTVI